MGVRNLVFVDRVAPHVEEVRDLPPLGLDDLPRLDLRAPLAVGEPQGQVVGARHRIVLELEGSEVLLIGDVPPDLPGDSADRAPRKSRDASRDEGNRGGGSPGATEKPSAPEYGDDRCGDSRGGRPP